MKSIRIVGILCFFLGSLVVASCSQTSSIHSTSPAPVKQVGVYSESHSATTGNAVVNISGSTVVITTNETNLSEGYEGLQVQVGSQGWVRFDLSPVSAVSMGDYAGYLNFSIKTTSIRNYLVGIQSSNGIAFWIPLTSSHYTADGKWYAVSIPVGSFSNVDTSSISSYFMLSNSGATTAGDLIYLDDIYWTADSVTSKLWNLVWSDEFTAANGSAIDTANNWVYEFGNNSGWGNNELETYTNDPANSYITNSNLVINAIYLSPVDPTGVAYSSARITTQGKRYWTYGRIAARMKLAVDAQGAWPAFWLLGTNITSVNWPQCGEIDIMECGNGGSFDRIGGTLHWGNNWSTDHHYQGNVYTLSSGTFADAYHVFEVEWNSTTLTWRVDNSQYYSMNVPTAYASYYDTFQKPFFIILNLAIGGANCNYTGKKPVDYLSLPDSVFVDWVRVYQLQP